MKKLVTPTVLLVMALALAPYSLAAPATEGTWTGTVTETHCGAAGTKPDHVDCAIKCVKEKNAKWALYTPADKGVWVLSNQEAAAKMYSKEVTVKGTLDKETKTITVTSMEPADSKN